MKEFGFVRHGHKLGPEEEGRSLEESGLTLEQQRKWKEAVTRLGIENNPQMGYENLPLIEQMAKGMYEKLPERALVIFTATDYPRAKLTADLISTELTRLSVGGHGKEIKVAFLWEHPDEKVKADSMSRIVDMREEMAANQRLLGEVQKRDYPDDLDFKVYLTRGGDKAYANENEALRRAVNLDLESEDSQYRKRASSFKRQLQHIETTFDDHNEPVFFYAVGHHPNLIAMDVAINGRTHYERSDEIPRPLTLWKVDKEKIEKFLEQDKEEQLEQQ